jgi:hypothetical protein
MASNAARSSVHVAGEWWTSSSHSTPPPPESRAPSPSMCPLSRMWVDATLPQSAGLPAGGAASPRQASARDRPTLL